jgi:hypothetical protein
MSGDALYNPSWLIRQVHGFARYGSFDHNNITTIQNDYIGYVKSIALTPGLVLGAFFVVSIACAAGSCDWCRKHPANEEYEPLTSGSASRRRRRVKQWWLIISILTGLLFLGGAAIEFYYEYQFHVTVDRLDDTGTDATNYQSNVEASIQTLQNELDHEHLLSVEILQQNRTVPPDVQMGMQQTSTDLASASNSASNIANQVNKDIGISSIVNQVHTYNGQANVYSIVWICLWVVFFIVIILVAVIPPTNIHMSRLRKCWYITAFVYGLTFLILSVVIGTLLAFAIPMGMSDACVNYSSWIRAEIGSDNSDTADYYLDCTYPLTGGPINPNIDDIQTQLQQSIIHVSAYVNATNGTSADSIYLLHNLTRTSEDLNTTRELVSCTIPNSLLSTGLHRACDDVFDSMFNFGLMQLLVPLLFIAFLFEQTNPVFVDDPTIIHPIAMLSSSSSSSSKIDASDVIPSPAPASLT